jgi:L-ribulose-5-phosphate 3-epimerase
MGIGVLAHLCGVKPPEELAEKVASHGYSYVQLAIWKAFAGYDFSLPGRLSHGLGNSISESFAKHGVSIPVLGCYVHLYTSDKTQFRLNINRFKEHLRYARFFGASVVAAETGKPEPGTSEEENWSRYIEGMHELTEEAEKWGVFIGIEPAQGHLIETSEKMLECLETLQSSSIGVVMDPCNMMNIKNFHKQDDVIRNAFSLLQDRIVSVHMKDIMPDTDNLREVPSGQGQLNYPLFLQLLDKYKPKVHMTMEGLDESQMKKAIKFIAETRESNVSKSELKCNLKHLK